MSIHKPVLLKESIAALNLKKGDVVVDATLGGGGHSRKILGAIEGKGVLIGIDTDIEAIKKFAEFPISNFQFPNKSEIPIFEIKNTYLVNSNFANLGSILKEVKTEKVGAILADLGYSSDQMDEAERGFSFQRDAELDMRMGRSLRNTNQYEYTNKITARDIINGYSEKELAKILSEYGEEKFAKNIAREICNRREAKEIRTTGELAEIIKSATPKRYHHQRINPATKTFQALRIEVNQELENLKKFIPQAIEALKPGGRLAIISFHSLEDRIVKNMFRENARGCICPPDFPQCRCGHKADIKIIAKKPVIPAPEEIENNPRSRSAKMRICEKS